MTAINIISATKGGSGKTLLSFILHKALFGLGRGEETLLIDASNGNKDLSCFLSKFSLEREKSGGRKNIGWISYRKGNSHGQKIQTYPPPRS